MSSSNKNLTADEINFIFTECGIEKDVIKSWYKEWSNTCPNGKMDKKQFYKFYKMLRTSTEKEKLSKITDHVFNCFDKDSNGTLSFSEFLIAYTLTTIGDPRKKLEFIFDFYDTDHDGIIKEKEFLHQIKVMYDFRGKDKKEYPPEKCAKDILAKIDVNGDGKLTKEEFIDGCLRNRNVYDLLSPFEF